MFYLICKYKQIITNYPIFGAEIFVIMKKYFAFQWHITDQCDQRCRHCYIFADRNHKICETKWQNLTQTLDNIVDMSHRMNRLPYLYITGGDPILHPRFWDLLQLIHSKNIPFTLMGNPFHLDLDVCEKMYSLGCQKYQLSLDGLRHTHDHFRKSGSFDLTLQKIPIIKASGIRCSIMTTVSEDNIAEIPDLIDVIVENKVDVWSFARYCPTDYKSVNNQGIAPLAYRDFLDKCWAKFTKYKNSKTTFNLKEHLWTLYLYEEGWWKIPQSADTYTIYGGCHCGDCHFTITADGRLMACRRFDSDVGSYDQNMYEVFYGKKMNYYRQYDKFEKCQRCELLRFCRGCPAVSYGYSGSYYAPDPQCWKEV